MQVTGIVIAGAGARGAYEAGVLSVLVPRLMEERGRRSTDRIVLLGTSAGAINTAILAAFADPVDATERAIKLWSSIGAPDIFAGVGHTALRDAVTYIGQIAAGTGRLTSLLDTSPLGRTMADHLDWAELGRNLTGAGWVHTAGVVTTACATGRTTVFLQGKRLRTPDPDDVRGIDYVAAELGVPHVLASAAIPVAFSPVHISEPASVAGWHTDGGVRVNAPIRPALDLKVDRLVVVATTPDPDTPRARPVSVAKPDVFDGAGVIMTSVLGDRMAEDVRSLRRTNKFVEREARAGVSKPRGSRYRVYPHMFLGPPSAGTIAAKANGIFKERYGGWTNRFSDLGLLGNLLGGSTDTHGELLSYLFFDPSFHAALVELGQEDAHQLLGAAGTDLPWRI